MADVRSMLRKERANRRIIHPHLTYTSTGTLVCLVCDIQVKTEALWHKHLNSTLHATNTQKTRDIVQLKSTSQQVNSSKKRKADDESSDEEIRKKTKGDGNVPLNGFVAEELSETILPPAASTVNDEHQTISTPPAISHPTANGIPSRPFQEKVPYPAIDEDEWAAFQRDVATPPPEPTALTAAADIVSAPLTAAELAAQSREQASKQAKERREAEVEGEKEDATRQLEEEFEEMAELEHRVKRLREKREALRVQNEEELDKQGRPPDQELQTEQAEDEGTSDGDDENEEGEEMGWGGWSR